MRVDHMPKRVNQRKHFDQNLAVNRRVTPLDIATIENQAGYANSSETPINIRKQAPHDPFCIVPPRPEPFAVPPPVIYWPHTLRQPTSVDDEIEQATACIRDCLRTFSVRTGCLPPSSYHASSNPSASVSALEAERDTLLRVQAESELDRENLTKLIAALQDEKRNLEISLQDAKNQVYNDYALEEFRNQQSFFELETLSLKREISDLRASLNFHKEASADAERNSQMYRAQLEASDRDKANLRLRVSDLEKVNRELSEQVPPRQKSVDLEICVSDVRALRASMKAGTFKPAESSCGTPITPADLEISSLSAEAHDFQAARAAIKKQSLADAPEAVKKRRKFQRRKN